MKARLLLDKVKRLSWWGLFTASSPLIVAAAILLTPRWLIKLAKLLLRPSKYFYRRARAPKTPAEHEGDLNKAGFKRGYGGAFVKNNTKPNKKKRP